MSKKLLYIPLAIFSAIMAYVLAVSSYLAKYFPLWSAGDLPIHIANIFFLDKYGFHSIVPNWYNGFMLFELYSPGWSYLGLFLQKITGNYLITVYSALVATYIIGFFGIYLIGKNQGFDKLKTTLFFLSFFFSYIVSVYAIRTGRFPELLAWALFTLFFYLVIYYKDKRLYAKIIFLPLVYALLMLTHIYVFAASSIMVLSLLMQKNNKERLAIISLLLLALIATSFWWPQFFSVSQKVRDGAYSYGVYSELLQQSSIISTNTILSIALLALLFFYLKENKKDLKFYTPVIVLDLLLLSRLVYFVPILRNVPATPYNVLFAFLSLFLLFKIQGLKVKRVLALALAIFSIFSLIYAMNIELRYAYNDTDKEFFSLFPEIKGTYFILDKESDVYHEKLAAYAAAYYDLSTPIGYFREYESLKRVNINGKEVLLKDALQEIRDKFTNKNCSFAKGLGNLGVAEIIVKNDYCNFAKGCGFAEKKRTASLCLLTVQNS